MKPERSWCKKIKQMIIIGNLFFTALPASANSFYNGSCTSQGDWVTGALSQAEVILNAMETLKNDPNCVGIESVIQNFKPAASAARGSAGSGGPIMEIRKLSREISDLRMMAMDGNASFRGRVMDVLMNRVSNEAEKKSEVEGLSVENAVKSASSISARTAVTIDAMAQGVNETLKVLPNLESCFAARPDQKLAITAGIISIMGTFIDAGEGVTSRFGNLMANFATYAVKKEFAKSMSQINEKQYYASLSCLMESSAQAYCSAKDASAILEDQKTRRLEERMEINVRENSELRGYFLLVRELPKISNWLQMVLNGLKPQMKSQAEFQQSVVESMNGLIKDKLALEGTYAQEKLTYEQTYKDDDSPDILTSKRSAVVELASSLVGIMYGGSMGSRNSQNFFEKVRPEEQAYFYILDIPYPEELKAANAMVSGKGYLKKNIDNIPELKDPDKAIFKIEENIEKMMISAMQYGTNYFTTWFIPDPTRIVDDAVASAPPNIYQSFINIKNYIDSVIVYYIQNREKRISELEEKVADLEIMILEDKTKYGELKRAKKVLSYFKSPTIHASMIDTRTRITAVLEEFEKRENLIKGITKKEDISQYITKDNKIDDEYFLTFINETNDCLEVPLADFNSKCKKDEEEKDYTKKLQNLDRELLEKTFEQFNVMLQRDTYLTNRFFGYIMSEYMERVQSGEDEDAYMNDLLAITGRNIVDKLISVNRLNPNNAKLDLSQAVPINFENLEAMEQLFADDLKIAICKITARIGGSEEAIETCGRELTRNEEREEICEEATGRRASRTGKKCKSSEKGILDQSVFNYGARVENMAKDDEFGYYDQLRAKYCIQALSFPKLWEEFEPICRGTKLISQFSEEAKMDEVKVDYSYDDFYDNSSTSSERICALRDYIRRNEVFWLLNSNNE